MSKAMNFLAIIKDNDQRYLFLFDDETQDQQLLTIWGEMAEDPELDFSWDDFDVLKGKLAAHRREVAAGGYIEYPLKRLNL